MKKLLIGLVIGLALTVINIGVTYSSEWTADLNVGLVSYYKFDETSGAIAVDSMNWADATINGATVDQTGLIGKAYSYDGNDYLITSTGKGITGGATRSIWAWVYPTSSTAEQMIYANGLPNNGCWFAWKINNGTLSLMGYGSDFDSSIAVSNNQWSLVGVSYSGTNLTLYKVNSTGITSQSATKTYNTSDAAQYIGVNYANGWNGYFHGKIDEFGIWNRTLTDSEKTQLYNSGAGITYIAPTPTPTVTSTPTITPTVTPTPTKSMDSPGLPSAGSGMYTLQNLYDYLTSGTALTVHNGFQEPTAGPGPTMRSTKQIGDDVKALFDQCAATAADMKSGVTFFCTKPGSWGIQTGTRP